MLNIFAIVWPKGENLPTEIEFEHDPWDLDIGGAVARYCLRNFGVVPKEYDWEYNS